ncbi:hypothetical protein EMCRGX_G013594 [Ephydatia muelleri]
MASKGIPEKFHPPVTSILPKRMFGSKKHLWAKLPPILNTNSSSMSLQWNAPLQPDYVITAYTLHHRVPSLKSQSEMWAPPSTATVQFHTYNPSGILFYQINSVMTDILEVKLHGGLPWLMFAQCGLWTSCRWIQQYQNLQRWSVAHFPSCNLCDGQGYVVLFEQASNTFYVTVDTVHAAAITAVIVPLLTMKHVSYPLLNAPDEFDAVSVQNVGSTYIIVSWDLPTDSNGILINFSLYCNGALAGVLPLTVISYNTTGLLPFTLYMYMSSSHTRRHCTPIGMWCWASSVLQPACPVMYMYTSRDICDKLHIPFILPVLTCWSHEWQSKVYTTIVLAKMNTHLTLWRSLQPLPHTPAGAGLARMQHEVLTQRAAEPCQQHSFRREHAE